MRKMLTYIYVILIVFIGIDAVAQPWDEDEPPFTLDTAVFPASGSESDVHMFVYIPYNALQFVKKESGYQAVYSLSVAMSRPGKEPIFVSDRSKRTNVQSYQSTINTDSMDFYHFKTGIDPGKYKIQIRLQDRNAATSRLLDRDIYVPKRNPNRLFMGDLIFLKNNHGGLTTKNMLSPKHVKMRKNIYLASIVSLPQNVRQLNVNVFFAGRPPQTSIQKTVNVSPPVDTIYVVMPREKMRLGLHNIKMNIAGGGDNSSRNKNVEFVTTGNYYTGYNIDQMVRQMVYIARGDEWDAIKNAEGERRKELFQAFWERRDPTPHTKQNELFNEYYKRIEVANHRFTSQVMPGWRTDRGHVYVIYGKPDEVRSGQSSDFGQGSYRIWIYQQIDKKFVFYDERGFDNYRLISGTIE